MFSAVRKVPKKVKVEFHARVEKIRITASEGFVKEYEVGGSILDAEEFDHEILKIEVIRN